MELASDSSLNGDQGGLVAQADTSQLVVAGYGHYVDGRGKRIMLPCPVLLSGGTFSGLQWLSLAINLKKLPQTDYLPSHPA